MAEDLIRECLLDTPLSNMTNRPQGMLAIRRDDVPEEVRPAVDAWVQERGGTISEEPLIVGHGGKTPTGGGARSTTSWRRPRSLRSHSRL